MLWPRNTKPTPLVTCCEFLEMWILCLASTEPEQMNFRSVPLEEMQRKFGEESIWVYNILRGIDYNPGETTFHLYHSFTVLY